MSGFLKRVETCVKADIGYIKYFTSSKDIGGTWAYNEKVGILCDVDIFFGQKKVNSSPNCTVMQKMLTHFFASAKILQE